MAITGGCYCGEIRYQSDNEPQASIQCHCRECQYITGGHPNAIVILPLAGFSFTKGEPKAFSRSDLARPVTRYFCPTCGTGIGTRSPARPESMIIKVGTLDDPSTFKAQAAIFTIDKQPFHVLPEGVPSFERRPG
ncbi:MAG: GFA family protein [Reyranella sp.]